MRILVFMNATFPAHAACQVTEESRDLYIQRGRLLSVDVAEISGNCLEKCLLEASALPEFVAGTQCARCTRFKRSDVRNDDGARHDPPGAWWLDGAIAIRDQQLMPAASE